MMSNLHVLEANVILVCSAEKTAVEQRDLVAKLGVRAKTDPWIQMELWRKTVVVVKMGEVPGKEGYSIGD